MQSSVFINKFLSLPDKIILTIYHSPMLRHATSTCPFINSGNKRSRREVRV